MLLSTVIIILREVLEGALLFSMLIRISTALNLSQSWFFPSLLVGFMGATFYALNINWISDSFEGVGQEITNASIQLLIYALIVFYSIIVIHFYYQKMGSLLIQFIMFLMGVLLISREGSEILLYFFSMTHHAQNKSAVIMGIMIGTSIGISLGFLFYYGLKALKRSCSLTISLIFLILVGAGMVSQATVLLIQADWLNAGLPVWNSSSWLSERSIIGQLLYYLFGYEATPSKIQVILYLGALICPIVLILLFQYRLKIMNK